MKLESRGYTIVVNELELKSFYEILCLIESSREIQDKLDEYTVSMCGEFEAHIKDLFNMTVV